MAAPISPAGTILFCREVPWESRLPVSTRKLAGCFAEAGWDVIWLTQAMRLRYWWGWKKIDPAGYDGRAGRPARCAAFAWG